MLRSLKELRGYGLQATDGELGKVEDFYFDDQHWALRYIVVDTRKWLPGRLVLISPSSFGSPDWKSSLIPVDLTKERVRAAPEIGEDQPVSRQYEEQVALHYSWPMYWTSTHAGPLSGFGAGGAATATKAERKRSEERAEGDPHLRSVEEVRGYDVHALDGDVGTVADFIAETDDWTLRYVIADTRKWRPGGKVLLSPLWIDRVDWTERHLRVDLNQSTLKECPEYDPSQPVNRQYEERLRDYYGRPLGVL